MENICPSESGKLLTNTTARKGKYGAVPDQISQLLRERVNNEEVGELSLLPAVRCEDTRQGMQSVQSVNSATLDREVQGLY